MSNSVLAANRWRHRLKGRRSLATFKVPPAVLAQCEIADGQTRAVSIAPSAGTPFSFRARISSGGELLMPAKYHSRVRQCEYLEISIDDAATPMGSKLETPVDIDEGFLEGGAGRRMHVFKERSPELVTRAKKHRLQSEGTLRCDVCGFSFEETYGSTGRGYIEAHHKIPISKLEGSTRTKVSDLALLCSNCHRMIHRRDPCTIEELKAILEERRGSSAACSRALRAAPDAAR